MSIKPEVLIDHNAFHAAHFLMHAKFQRLLGYFFEDTENYLLSIEQGYLEQMPALIIPPAHTIKSSSLQLGAVGLSKAAAKLEADAKHILSNNSGIEILAVQIQNLRHLFMLSRQELEMLSQQRIQ